MTGLGGGASIPTNAQVQGILDGFGVGDVGTYTLASLPNPSATPRRTIWVTDLWTILGGNAGGRMVSEGGFWKPIRPLVLSSMAMPVSDATVQPFVNGTTILCDPLAGISPALQADGNRLGRPEHHRRDHCRPRAQ